MRTGCVPQPMRLVDDTHIVEKPGEQEKIDHYQDLKVEVQKDLEVQRRNYNCNLATNASGTPDHARSQENVSCFVLLYK